MSEHSANKESRYLFSMDHRYDPSLVPCNRICAIRLTLGVTQGVRDICVSLTEEKQFKLCNNMEDFGGLLGHDQAEIIGASHGDKIPARFWSTVIKFSWRPSQGCDNV